ncbi:uncharacterized protein N7469_008432 [Penicillium citrinum]|uniref:Uncharacterized protein n=1 Tax=Penicillium citrinum TaxID=5077 RepID=A0A9W9TJK4_PENCI|nr:uncharacterized protein N7469_008432 [Penicillium citrinum]KAJ5224929.1 hypothetical protein N7469_008432 [Penicillium citrinum]KAK5796442.1 hypothetical protein VI817_005727 [Penicillium citrinum]
MGSLDLDQDISPIPRSREENQERAFIAASRRKDRSLDARLESANRASMLHKKRTGKAFHITKEIVEKEAMYEEVDERYQEKRIRMLQAQNMAIEEQFHRHLLAAFASRANSSGSVSSIASRRASATPRASVDGGSSRKMSIDLSHLRSPSHSLTSPMATTTDGYAMSPSTNYDPNVHSYMNCMDGSDGSASAYQNMTGSASTATSSAQIPAYITQPTQGLPVWPTQMPWTNMQQQVPTPNQTPTDTQAVHMWQQQMMQQAQTPTDSASQIRQFRDRLASAPELPLHSTAPPAPAASISGPSTSSGHSGLGHSRGSSHPTNNFHNLQLLTQGTHLAQMGPSNTSSPKIEALSAETQSTPDFCPTPNTPLSPTMIGVMPTTMSTTKEAETDMVAPELDPDYSDFSEFAYGLGGNSSLSDRDAFGFDDFVALDEFGTVTC